MVASSDHLIDFLHFQLVMRYQLIDMIPMEPVLDLPDELELNKSVGVEQRQVETDAKGMKGRKHQSRESALGNGLRGLFVRNPDEILFGVLFVFVVLLQGNQQIEQFDAQLAHNLHINAHFVILAQLFQN